MNIKFFDIAEKQLLSCNFVIPVGINTIYKKYCNFAHLIEHLIFHGHPKFSQYSLMDKIEQMGGIINAITEEDHTEIFFRVSEEYVEDAIELLYQAIREFAISNENIDAEYNIVRIEERQKNDDPVMDVRNRLLSSKMNDICTQKLSFEVLNKIYKDLYHIENWQLLIVGEVSQEKKRNIRKLLHEDNVTIDKKNIVTPQYYVEKDECWTKRIGEKNYFFYIHKCSSNCLTEYMKIAKYILVSGLSSFFYDLLVAEEAYTYSIHFIDFLRQGNFFLIYFPYQKEDDKKLIEIFEKVFGNKNFWNNLSDNTVQRAVNMTITEYQLKAESVSSMSRDIIEAMLSHKEFVTYDDIIQSLSRVSNNMKRRILERSMTGDSQ